MYTLHCLDRVFDVIIYRNICTLYCLYYYVLRIGYNITLTLCCSVYSVSVTNIQFYRRRDAVGCVDYEL